MVKRILCVARQAGVDDFSLTAVLSGIRIVLDLIDVERKSLDIADRTYWVSLQAISACRYSPGHIEGGKLLTRLTVEKKITNGLYVLALREKIVVSVDGKYAYCQGLGRSGIGALVDVGTLQGAVGTEELFDGIRRLTIHEMGHVLGLLPEKRKENVENRFGPHCTNDCCIMRSGGSYSAMVDLVNPYCEQCLGFLLRGEP